MNKDVQMIFTMSLFALFLIKSVFPYLHVLDVLVIVLCCHIATLFLEGFVDGFKDSYNKRNRRN